MKFALKTGIVDGEKSTVKSRRQLFIASVAIVVVLTSLGAFIGYKLSGNTKASPEFSGNIETRWDACKLFSLEDAKKVMGKTATISKNNANAVSSNATVSTCSYSSGHKKPEDLTALTVLVRSSNKIQARQAFEVARPQDATDIKNLGDQANYSSETSQLNLLRDENWVIIALNKGGSESKGTIDAPKQVAEIIDSRL